MISQYIPLLIFTLTLLWKSYQLYNYKKLDIQHKHVDKLIYDYLNKKQGDKYSDG